jgi:cysteine desulfurase
MPDPVIYLDNCATTQPAPEVVAAMAECAARLYGHPGTPHRLGHEAAEAVEEARGRVASFIGARAAEIVFTSGGTEANNLALLGAARAAGRGHVITSAVEHSSVLASLKALAREGFETTIVPVGVSGLVDPEAMLWVLKPETVCVSLMHVNNETGAVEPVAEVGRLLKAERPEVLYHVDAVQASGKVAIDVGALKADLLSISAHKVHGPKGVGALYVRPGTKLLPLLYGGLGQGGLRPGTENVPGIIGFGKAVELVAPDEAVLLKRLRDRLLRGLREIPGAILNGPLAEGEEHAAPHIVNVSFPGVPSASLLAALSARGVCASGQSACGAGGSHVLAAMGLAPELRESAIRLCVSVFNTEEEMDAAAEGIGWAVEELRLPAGPT